MNYSEEIDNEIQETEMDLYMIINSRDCGLPLVRHEGIEAAREAAKRLATKFPKDTFYVMRIVESVRVSESPFEILRY